MSAALLGIDLGGTKIEGAVIRPEAPDAAVFRTRLPTESVGGYDHIVAQVVRVVGQLREHCGENCPAEIGIGTPGTVDPQTMLLRGSNTQCLNGRPFKADLQSALGLRVEMANDANCFALAEATMGAAKGYETVFGIIMGTGCGGGFVVNGRVLGGCHGIAGEWGQNVLDPEGEVSGYGTRGIVETVLAGPALESFYQRLAGRRRPLKDVIADVGSDPFSQVTIDHLCASFARAVAVVINTFDPHAIVIGGGVGNIDVLYTDATRALIGDQIFAPSFEAVLVKPSLGDSAGVFGAAMLTA